MKVFCKLIILSFILVFASCRGDQEAKLVGSWDQIPFTDPELTTQKTIWEFYAGDALHVYKVVDEVITDSIKYTYQIAGSVFDVFDGVDNPGYAPAARDPRGQYWIDELSKSNFKATKRKHPDGSTDAVFMRIELVKR